MGCSWIQTQPPHQQSGEQDTLCVPKPARHWLCPFALCSVRLWEVPVIANSPPGQALSVVKGPLPPSSISRAPSTSALPRTAPSTSLWIVSSPSSPTALWSAQLGKSGDLGTPEAQGQQGMCCMAHSWNGVPVPGNQRLEQDQLGTCQARLRQTLGGVPAFPWVFSFRELLMGS